MTRHAPARQKLGTSPLTAAGIASIFRSTFPRRNNYVPVNYSELLEEALHFGIRTRKQLRRVILRHRREVIDVDRGPFDPASVKSFRVDLGDEVFADYARRQIFWSWEGLARSTMEREFGEKYRVYIRQRYGA